MSTDFSTKCEILAEVHAEAQWNEELEDLKEYNDIGLPLAYLTHLELATPDKRGKDFIEETWRGLCEAYKVDPDAEYLDADDLLAKATNSEKDEEDDDEE